MKKTIALKTILSVAVMGFVYASFVYAIDNKATIDLTNDDGRPIRGWRALNEALRTANEGEGPAVRRANKMAVEWVTAEDDSIVILNYDTLQRRVRKGTDRTNVEVIDPALQPWIKKEILKVTNITGSNYCKLSYDATGGIVLYTISFHFGKRLESINAVTFMIKGEKQPIDLVLGCGEKAYYYPLYNLKNEWEKKVIPLRAFQDFPFDDREKIDSLTFRIDGSVKEGEVASYAGAFFLDEIALDKIS